MAISQFDRGIRLDTPLGFETLVFSSARFEEELSNGFRGELLALSEDASIQARDLVGKTVTLTLDTRAGPRYFNAHVGSFLFSGMRGRLAAYRMELVPWMHVLTLRSDCRIHQKLSVPEIIEETIGRTPFSDKLDMSELDLATYDKRDFCVQYNETTSDFLFRLMQEEGIVSRYRHEEGAHTLVLSDWNDRFEPVPGYERLPWYPPDRQSREEESVSSWNWSNRMRPGAYATDDYDFTVPSKILASESIMPDDHVHDDGEIYAWPGGYTEPERGEHLSHLRREQLQVDRETVNANSDATGLRPGHVFSLENFPRSEANKNWLVTRINHVISGINYESGGGGAIEYSNSFTASDPKMLYRPNRSVMRPSIYGAQTAVVTGPEDEEIWTDEHARITVSFPWDRHGPKDGDSSCWIRVAQSWAGPSWGAQYIPRIGQEVVVEFLDGNPDTPIVTGCVYNGKNKPPFELPQNKTRSGLKTNSTKDARGYNMMRFEDMESREQIDVHAQRDMNSIVRRDHLVSVDRSAFFDVGGEYLSRVTRNSVHEVGGTVEISSGRGIVISTGPTGHSKLSHLRIPEPHPVNFDKTKRALKQMNSAVASGGVTIHAHTVLNENVGSSRVSSVGTTSTEVVGSIKTFNAGEMFSVTSGSAVAFATADTFTVQSGERIDMVCGDTSIRSTSDGVIAIDAGSQIKLTCGSASIEMNSDGSISIKGSDIKVKGDRIDLN